MRHMILAAALAAALATAAEATTVVFNFDDLTAGDLVGAYNGAVFTNFEVGTGFGQTSNPNFAFNTDPVARVDYAPGFTGLSFTAGVFDPYTVLVFSGLGGTGEVVGVLEVTDPPASPDNFAFVTIPLSGTGRHIVVFGFDSAQFGWDDLTLTTGVIPEPATWAMLIAGFGLVGATARRRRAVTA